MRIHEYQAKKIFKKFGIPVPEGAMAESPERVQEVASSLAGSGIVIKAQVHAGGRGKGGGVHLVGTPEEAKRTAQEMLGMTLVTPQTGPSGKVVRKVLVEKAVDVRAEIYLGVTIDRRERCIVLMGSEAGGVDIEQVAREMPDKILSERVDPTIGFRPFQASRLSFGLNLPSALVREGARVVSALYRFFCQMDCSLAEINPLAITGEGELVALDGKINFDENAIFRHRRIEDLRDVHEEARLEVEASLYNLKYVKLDGNVGCMVNGAGLAMATMDMIKLIGGEPANFLDVGGGPTVNMVKHGFQIILSDPNVKIIFVNIFGGVSRCDILAKGVVEASKGVGTDLPLVIRLEGTNVEEGRRILAESGLNFITAVDMNDAAQKVLSALKSA